MISIDGNTGAGKSTLASNISEKLGIIHLKLDDEKFLHQNKGGCLKFVKFNVLLNEIELIVESGKISIVDSVCILKILDNIGINSDLKLYVKRLSSYGHWYDERKFDYTRTASDIINEEMDGVRLINNIAELSIDSNEMNEDQKNTLHDEIIEYHFEYKPNENADIIYNRIENSV